MHDKFLECRSTQTLVFQLNCLAGKRNYLVHNATSITPAKVPYKDGLGIEKKESALKNSTVARDARSKC